MKKVLFSQQQNMFLKRAKDNRLEKYSGEIKQNNEILILDVCNEYKPFFIN